MAVSLLFGELEMAPTLANVKKLAAQFEAEVTVDPPLGLIKQEVIHIDLPEGKHWSANDTGMVSGVSFDMSSSSRKVLYAELIEEMERGVEDCPSGGCDECEL